VQERIVNLNDAEFGHGLAWFGGGFVGVRCVRLFEAPFDAVPRV
jgi:hypothetical protein